MILSNPFTVTVWSIVFTLTFSMLQPQAEAAVKTETLIYNSNGDTMEGFLAYDESSQNSSAQSKLRPGILVVHDWMGLGSFTKNKATELAGQGFIVLAVDVYGQGLRPKNADEAAQFAGKFKNNRTLFRAHLRAAYDKLLTKKNIDPNKIAVMGYCFGGTGALELARSGAKLAGTISFHGGLSNPTPPDASKIQGRVLILHGADDPHVPPTEVISFQEEMKKAQIKFDFISYPGAMHAFAVPSAGTNIKSGVAYNAEADKKSWLAFENFLKEIF